MSWEPYATGLRNAMAMAIDPVSGTLWQAENSRDNIQLAIPGLANDNALPHDELNRIERGSHYHGHRIVALLAERTGPRRSVDLVTGTHPQAGIGVMAPVGIQQGIDGALYFADDHAHAIFKLQYNASSQ